MFSAALCVFIGKIIKFETFSFGRIELLMAQLRSMVSRLRIRITILFVAWRNFLRRNIAVYFCKFKEVLIDILIFDKFMLEALSDFWKTPRFIFVNLKGSIYWYFKIYFIFSALCEFLKKHCSVFFSFREMLFDIFDFESFSFFGNEQYS